MTLAEIVDRQIDRPRRTLKMLGYKEDLRLGSQFQKGGDGAAVNSLDHEIANQLFLIRHDHGHFVAHDFASQAHFLGEGGASNEGADFISAGLFSRIHVIRHYIVLMLSTERGLLMANAPAAVAITLSRFS